jgi:hypothetical protein
MDKVRKKDMYKNNERIAVSCVGIGYNIIYVYNICIGYNISELGVSRIYR